MRRARTLADARAFHAASVKLRAETLETLRAACDAAAIEAHRCYMVIQRSPDPWAPAERAEAYAAHDRALHARGEAYAAFDRARGVSPADPTVAKTKIATPQVPW